MQSQIRAMGQDMALKVCKGVASLAVGLLLREGLGLPHMAKGEGREEVDPRA